MVGSMICSCDMDPPRPCYYHGCGDCHHTPASAKAVGLPTGHAPGCRYRPRLETETL